jgi:two-component system chemotaxis sensor kinase CheA
VDRELRQLRDAAEGLKLIPVDSILMALNRTARDSARLLGKQVTFEGAGGDIRLDAEVLGTIQGALIQIVRNAVAHGIELESERRAAGKPAAGRVTVGVSRRGSKMLFECRDDGRGIDLAAVRKVATERGLLSPPANELDAEDLVGILLRGGVSTSAAVTDVAGRGIGLDVVREALERLGGEVSVSIDPGRGTTFELLIPRSVASMPALLVEAGSGGGAIAIPLDGVRRILRLAAGDIACTAAGASILYEQHAVPFIPLATALDGTHWSVGRGWTAIIVEGSGRIGAIGIERLVGTTRTVVRPLPDRLKANPLTVGAALDGEGNPQLILDPDGLVAAAHGARAAELAPAPAKRPVLVIDDSLTTRMLEKSILESAGYEVDVASSGEEGLDLARRRRFSLILCDVEMPGIDGFTFVERIRSDPALRDIPAILVTSRSAPEDRQRGRDVGAHAYIVKNEFNQAELLAMIRPMAG